MDVPKLPSYATQPYFGAKCDFPFSMAGTLVTARYYISSKNNIQFPHLIYLLFLACQWHSLVTNWYLWFDPKMSQNWYWGENMENFFEICLEEQCMIHLIHLGVKIRTWNTNINFVFGQHNSGIWCIYICFLWSDFSC